MPEIPDLEAIRHYLMPRLDGLTVAKTEAPIPWLVRTGAEDLATIEGHRFGEIHRLGKFLLFFLDEARILVINPMLTGRFHWVEAGAKKTGSMGVIVGFDDGHVLRDEVPAPHGPLVPRRAGRAAHAPAVPDARPRRDGDQRG